MMVKMSVSGPKIPPTGPLLGNFALKNPSISVDSELGVLGLEERSANSTQGFETIGISYG